MHERIPSIAASLLALTLAAPAAWSTPYGTLELKVGTFDPLVVPGSTSGVSTPSRIAFGPGANFTTTLVVPLTSKTEFGAVIFPAHPLVDLRLTGPAGLTAASFSAGAAPDGGFGGDAALTGNSKIGLFGPPAFSFLTIPLDSVGVEGATVMDGTSPFGVSITVFGGGWTTGTVQVIGTTGAFAGMLLAEAEGRDSRTVRGDGTIVLVSPALARTNVSGSENLPLVATLTLNNTVIPEPGTLLLLGSGLAGLAAARRSRCAPPRQ